MARPSRPLLSRPLIVDTALALIDGHGLAALSTRRLATELGVSGPSLYNHFATKEELLEAVADRVVAGVDLAVFGTADWREAITAWADSYHRILARHPNVIPLIATGPARRPASLAMTDAVYGALTGAGWPPARATHIGAVLRYFVIGASVGSFAAGFSDDPAVYATHYPHLREAHRLADHAARVDRTAFDVGLSALLDGLAAGRPPG